MPEKKLFEVHCTRPKWYTQLTADALMTQEEAWELERQLGELGFKEITCTEVFPPDGPMSFDAVVEWFRRQR
jgi:hypothetical protein